MGRGIKVFLVVLSDSSSLFDYFISPFVTLKFELTKNLVNFCHNAIFLEFLDNFMNSATK